MIIDQNGGIRRPGEQMDVVVEAAERSPAGAKKVRPLTGNEAIALGALVALSGICDRNRIEQAVRAETPRGFLDLNMDALKAGYAVHTQAAAQDEIAGTISA